MKNIILPLLLAITPAVAMAQDYSEPVTASDSLATNDPEEAEAVINGILNFTKGHGAPIDTLDVGDEVIKVVLCDDNTWYFVKDLTKLAGKDVFTDHWTENVVNPYSDIALSDLPYHATIVLADSVSRWNCPYQTKVFSKFGMRHGRRHQGVDLPYPTGTPVKVAFDGRVRVSMYTKGYGNLVIVRHENGLETYYGHLSKRQVEPGQWVHSGDIIGLGGSTGHSTGPHLHFETRWRGYAFDPMWISDFESGKLHKNVFVLRRSYLDAYSRYVPESLEEEDDVFGMDEKIDAEEKRIAAEKAAMRWHTVRSGETVSHIAIKNGKSLKQIQNLNPGLNINKIRIGQKIRVN